MQDPDVFVPFSTPVPRHVMAASLWLRLGLIALFVIGGAFFALVAGDARPASALAWMLGAAGVFAYAYRRSATLLDLDAEPEATPRPAAVSAIPVTSM